jgi:hypothetical protein
LLAQLEKLARVRQWDEASDLAARALDADVPSAEVFTRWAQGALLAGAAERSLRILGRLSMDERSQRYPAQLRVQCLLELQQNGIAQRTAEKHLVAEPDDQVMRRLLSRVRSRKEVFEGADPFDSLARAKQLVRRGEHDAALRILRVLAHEHADEPKLRIAIRNVEHRRKVAARARLAAEDMA